jgi:sulfotransferase
MKIVFNSSLPRTGSTLLQNILAQNPAFHCSPTSGVLELLYGARSNFTNCPEFKAQNQKEVDSAFADFCHHGLMGYYHHLNKDVVFDKSRGWMAYYDWLKSFYPDPKIIVCIRDLRAVLSSMEKIFRSNPNRQPAGEDAANMKFLTVDARVGYWMSTPPIGLALNRLADAIHRGNDKHFFFLRFEDLNRDPGPVLNELYEFIGEPEFAHDLDNIPQATHENDLIYGIPDLHTIRPRLSAPKPDWNEILGKDLSQAIVIKNRWFYDRFYPNAS